MFERIRQGLLRGRSDPSVHLLPTAFVHDRAGAQGDTMSTLFPFFRIFFTYQLATGYLSVYFLLDSWLIAWQFNLLDCT